MGSWTSEVQNCLHGKEWKLWLACNKCDKLTMINSRWLNSSLVFFPNCFGRGIFLVLAAELGHSFDVFSTGTALLFLFSFLRHLHELLFLSCAVSFYFVLFFPSNQTSDTSKDEHIMRLWPVVKSQYHSFLRPTHFCFLLLFCWSISHIVSLFSALIICIMEEVTTRGYIKSQQILKLCRVLWNLIVSRGGKCQTKP